MSCFCDRVAQWLPVWARALPNTRARGEGHARGEGLMFFMGSVTGNCQEKGGFVAACGDALGGSMWREAAGCGKSGPGAEHPPPPRGPVSQRQD